MWRMKSAASAAEHQSVFSDAERRWHARLRAHRAMSQRIQYRLRLRNRQAEKPTNTRAAQFDSIRQCFDSIRYNFVSKQHVKKRWLGLCD